MNYRFSGMYISNLVFLVNKQINSTLNILLIIIIKIPSFKLYIPAIYLLLLHAEYKKYRDEIDKGV